MYALLFLGALSACPFKFFNQEQPEERFVKPFTRRKELGDADPETKTPHNCKCSSECGGDLLFDGGACDWCWTENGCGHSTLTGSWDYCIYDEIPSWESKTAADKMSTIWGQITANTDPGDFPFPSVPLNPIAFSESVRTTFDNNWDWMPAGRVKTIHAQGMVCKVDLKVSSSKYTGIFQSGTAQGLLRIGSALPVTSITGIVPGIGMKFFRNGVHSANWVMLHSLEPQIGDTYDMFHYTQYNHIAAPPVYAIPLAKKFEQASGCIEAVGLSDVSEYTQAGTKVTNANFPFKLEYRTGDAKMPDGGCSQPELMQRMLAVGKKGVKLYDVYAYETPTSQAELIGTLTVDANTDCVSSKYGDERLFIRHQRIEEDWAKRLEWTMDIPASVCAGTTAAQIMDDAGELEKCADISVMAERDCMGKVQVE